MDNEEKLTKKESQEWKNLSLGTKIYVVIFMCGLGIGIVWLLLSFISTGDKLTKEDMRLVSYEVESCNATTGYVSFNVYFQNRADYTTSISMNFMIYANGNQIKTHFDIMYDPEVMKIYKYTINNVDLKSYNCLTDFEIRIG